MVKKDRTFCSSYDCMIKTCSRHRCHLPKWYNKPLVWVDFPAQGCDLYVSKHSWKNLETDGDRCIGCIDLDCEYCPLYEGVEEEDDII